MIIKTTTSLSQSEHDFPSDRHEPGVQGADSGRAADEFAGRAATPAARALEVGFFCPLYYLNMMGIFIALAPSVATWKFAS